MEQFSRKKYLIQLSDIANSSHSDYITNPKKLTQLFRNKMISRIFMYFPNIIIFLCVFHLFFIKMCQKIKYVITSGKADRIKHFRSSFLNFSSMKRPFQHCMAIVDLDQIQDWETKSRYLRAFIAIARILKKNCDIKFLNVNQ